jgi:hypothetical protein
MHGYWQLIAHLEDRGDTIRATHVFNIRNWGTRDKGFGHLALHGPTEATNIDPEPDQVLDRVQIIRALPCTDDARAEWEKKFKKVLKDRS